MKKRLRIRMLMLAMALPAICGQWLVAGVQVVDLKCEYSADPLGIDVAQPRLYWRLEADQDAERQTAWQVLVASSPQQLSANVGDLWDSGKMESDQTTHIHYAGRTLVSSQKVYWKVRSWDKSGKPSPWSPPATWTMGILDAAEWTGEWITSPEPAESLLFRNAFAIKKPVRRALIHISGLGHYELYLNGRKIGQDLLSPGWTDYNETTLFDTHDITSLLQDGGNALGVLLGNGMYHVERNGRFAKFEGSFGRKRLIADIYIEYADGSIDQFGTSPEWLSHSGPITFSSIYGGEDFDARLLDPDWAKPGFAAPGWEQAVPVDSASPSTLRGHSASSNPVRVMQVLDPVEVRPLAGPGATLFDFGQNTSIMPVLKVNGPRGSVVRMIPGELVYPDGQITRSSMGGVHRGFSWWEYTKSTDGPEIWMPSFFYIGSRYIQTQAIPAEAGRERPVVESLQAAVVHADAEPLGEFSTSNELLNRIRELVRWAQCSNMVSVLTDCPHREKLGWLEQYHLNGPSIRYEYDVARIYTKGMNDMADAQTPEGMVPNIAPEFVQFRGTFRSAAEWGAAFILVPWQQYLFDADTDLLKQYYPEMKRYFSYLESRASKDILAEGLGDWYDLGPRAPGRAQLTFPPLTATAFLQHDAVILARVARLLGEQEDARHFDARAKRIRERFNEEFFNPEERYYGQNSQAANAIALVFDLVDPQYRADVLEHLRKNVVENEYRMTAGDVGFRFLIQALSEGGLDDVVFRMINHERNPGYGYQLKMGATALTESWNASPNSSNNHFMLGHITEWFYEDLLGIGIDASDPGFKTVRIYPRPVGDLEWVEGSYNSLHGSIKVRWERTADSFELLLTIPPNTQAQVFLPTRDAAAVQHNGTALQASSTAQTDGNRLMVPVESGKHRFHVTHPNFQMHAQ